MGIYLIHSLHHTLEYYGFLSEETIGKNSDVVLLNYQNIYESSVQLLEVMNVNSTKHIFSCRKHSTWTGYLQTDQLY